MSPLWLASKQENKFVCWLFNLKVWQRDMWSNLQLEPNVISSVKHCNFTPNFSESQFFRTNFCFHWHFSSNATCLLRVFWNLLNQEQIKSDKSIFATILRWIQLEIFSNTTPLLSVGGNVHLSSQNIFESSVEETISVCRRNDLDAGETTAILPSVYILHEGRSGLSGHYT